MVKSINIFILLSFWSCKLEQEQKLNLPDDYICRSLQLFDEPCISSELLQDKKANFCRLTLVPSGLLLKPKKALIVRIEAYKHVAQVHLKEIPYELYKVVTSPFKKEYFGTINYTTISKQVWKSKVQSLDSLLLETFKTTNHIQDTCPKLFHPNNLYIEKYQNDVYQTVTHTCGYNNPKLQELIAAFLKPIQKTYDDFYDNELYLRKLRKEIDEQL